MNHVVDNDSAIADTEARVLGIAFLSQEAVFYAESEARLRPHHFYTLRYGRVWAAMRALFEQHGQFDRTTLRAHMERAGTLEDAGGDATLDTLATVPVVAAGNFRQYVDLIIDAANRRRIVRLNVETIERERTSISTPDLLAHLERDLLDLSRERETGGYRHIGAVLDEGQERLHALSNGEVVVQGVLTGLTALDEITGGFRAGQLIVIGARPGQGKSALVTGVGEYAATHDQAVVLNSLEMAESEIAERLISARTLISAERLRRGEVRPDKWPGIMQSNAQLALAPLWIDDTSDLSVPDIRARVRRHAARNRVDMLIVDYLQLLRADGGENRTQAVGEMSRGLKIIARELAIPVIALSQLNRSVESRTDKKPVLADLRESGSIEQDADMVLFLFREEYYDPETERKGEADIIVAKNRGGRLGTATVGFDGPTMRFFNLPELRVAA